MLHLAGVKQLDKHGKPTGELAVPLDQIKQFRQLHSRTPGHPENFDTSGVETTTGPLGQGCGNSVGMAIASRWLAARYNQPGFELFDFNVYALCSDGDLMEGVCCRGRLAGRPSEAVEPVLDLRRQPHHDRRRHVAGLQRRRRHAVQGLRLERRPQSPTPTTWTRCGRPIKSFTQTNDRPTLIIVRSHIAYGVAEQGRYARGPRRAAGRRGDQAHQGGLRLAAGREVPGAGGGARALQQGIGKRGAEAATRSGTRSSPSIAKKHPRAGGGDRADANAASCRPAGTRRFPTFPADAKGMASRISGGKVLNAVAAKMPWLIGGSADLAPSTMTLLKFDGAGALRPADYGGRNFHFGIREHGMAAACNGMALCGLRPFGATFFIFSDYLRPSHAAGRPDGLAGALRLHARFDRRGRRRPDAPAGRAPGRLPGDSRPDRDAARRRQRSGRGLSRGPADATDHPRGAGAHAAEPADARPHEVRLRGRRGQRRATSCWTPPAASRR